MQFIGEEGLDEGGVKKEFFQLIFQQLWDVKYGKSGLAKATEHEHMLPTSVWSLSTYHGFSSCPCEVSYGASIVEFLGSAVLHPEMWGMHTVLS